MYYHYLQAQDQSPIQPLQPGPSVRLPTPVQYVKLISVSDGGDCDQHFKAYQPETSSADAFHPCRLHKVGF